MAPRRLSGWLLCGLLVAPGLFVWLLLRRGYSNQLRAGGFAYAAFVVASGLVHYAELLSG